MKPERVCHFMLPHATVNIDRLHGRTYLTVLPTVTLIDDRSSAELLARVVNAAAPLLGDVAWVSAAGTVEQCAAELERAAAELRGVPKTCEHCRHWDRDGVSYGGKRQCLADRSMENLGADTDCWFGAPANFGCNDWEKTR